MNFPLRRFTTPAAFCAAVLLGGCAFRYDPPQSVTRTTTVSSDGTGKTTVIVNGKLVSSSGNTLPTTRVVEKNVPAASLQTVQVRSDFGGITLVQTSDSTQISVHAEISLSDDALSKADRRKYLAGFTVETKISNGTLYVEAKPPAGFPAHIGFGALFRVGVPQGSRLNLDAKTVNGAVVVDNTNTEGDVSARSDFGEVKVTNAGTNAKIDVRTTNGAVTVKNDAPVQVVVAKSDFGAVVVRGQAEAVDARTTNGAVTVGGAVRARTVSAHSDFGSITITDCGGTIEAVTTNGAVTFHGKPEHLTEKSDFGSVHGVLDEGAAPQSVALSTSNGSVEFSTPRSASLRITARTSSGGISASGVQGKTSGDRFDKSYAGTVGGGAAPVELRTDFGSITITAR